jgi:hypothetical protein
MGGELYYSPPIFLLYFDKKEDTYDIIQFKGGNNI